MFIASPRASIAPLRPQRGFTLIELMVAMVVSSIVVLGIFAFSSIQQSTTDIHERHVRVQRALEGSMWSIAQDMQAAGLGWTRICTELRVWDAENNELINPGAVVDPSNSANVVTDPLTGEPYWVLRDGVQAFWRSPGPTTLIGTEDRSSSTTSPADAFDVIVAEANYVEATGVFAIDANPVGSGGGVDDVNGTMTVTANPTALPTSELDEVQQLFPPGSFLILVRTPDSGLAVHPTLQGQCVLLQITDDVTSGADGEFTIPVGNGSDFNALAELIYETVPPDEPGPCNSGCDSGGGTGGDDDGCGTGGGQANSQIECDDFDGTFDWVVPLGRVRWSRYEIDYTIPAQPYLVRYDIIGAQTGDPTFGSGTVEYPHCLAGNPPSAAACPGAGLHLFSSANDGPEAVAIGPMIEDMQIAVGCDGYTTANAGNAVYPIPSPDDGHDETVQYVQPDGVVDEQTVVSTNRDEDEWLGNSVVESWAPDCVYWGTAESKKGAWATFESNSPTASFRLSPQMLRVTLVGSSEFTEEAGGLSTDQLAPIEDRAAITSPVGARTRFTLTETFTPQNLRWRDPSIF